MKKMITIILCAMLCLMTFPVLAETLEECAAMIEMDYEHSAVLFRIPKNWKFQTPDEDIISELTPGEEDGDTFVKMFSPEEGAVGVGEIRFGLNPEQDNGTATAVFEVTQDGTFRYAELSLHSGKDDSPYIKLSEDGKTLTVTIDCNATTGYEWTCYPDNSGILEIVSEHYTPKANDEGLVGVGGTYICVLKLSEGNIPGKEGGLLFRYERSFDENSLASELCGTYTLNDDMTAIVDISSDMYALFE